MNTRPQSRPEAELPELSDLPDLPECWTGSPVTVTWAEDGEKTTREVYTADQLRAYGQQCAATRQSEVAGLREVLRRVRAAITAYGDTEFLAMDAEAKVGLGQFIDAALAGPAEVGGDGVCVGTLKADAEGFHTVELSPGHPLPANRVAKLFIARAQS